MLSVIELSTYHTTIVQSLSERLQVFRRAEMRVDRVDILLPIPMICLAVSSALLNVLSDGGDPDGVEAHPLDVV